MSVPTTPGDNPMSTNIPAGPAGTPTTPAGDARVAGAAGRAIPTVSIATFPDYESAQRAVDYLSDNRFPVERTAIIGTDLRLVENVIGRMTVGRAALAGVATGAWFGLLIGLLLSLFTTSAWWGILLAGLLIGAAWGAVFGAIAHAMTGGRRDFASRSMLQAGQYAVTVDAEYADQARQLITRMNWQASGAG